MTEVYTTRPLKRQREERYRDSKVVCTFRGKKLFMKRIACSSPQPLVYERTMRSSVMGGMNCHIEILFADGVRWLARIRRSNATSLSPDLRDYMRSEVVIL